MCSMGVQLMSSQHFSQLQFHCGFLYYNCSNTRYFLPYLMLTLKTKLKESFRSSTQLQNFKLPRNFPGKKMFSSHFLVLTDRIKYTTEYKATTILCYKNSRMQRQATTTMIINNGRKNPYRNPKILQFIALDQMLLMCIYFTSYGILRHRVHSGLGH